MDLHQLWDIVSKPDNVPILILIVTLTFYVAYALRQAFANDRLIAQLEGDAEMAKTHHRTTWPYKEGWPKLVHVWPHLLKIEFLAAIIVTVILIVWSVVLDAPLEEPANPSFTMNPSKAPWYFLGLQEMLVYFDPWLAGVLFPGLIIGGLIIIPYCDVNPLGNGYYTWKQRKFAISVFFYGFFILWILLIIIGVFIRGPGWMWFWPGATWDHHRQVYEINRDLHEIFGVTGKLNIALFGAAAFSLITGATAVIIHKLYTKYKAREYAAMNFIQYKLMQIHLIGIVFLTVKIILRLTFRIKYIWVTPWFNI